MGQVAVRQSDASSNVNSGMMQPFQLLPFAHCGQRNGRAGDARMRSVISGVKKLEFPTICRENAFSLPLFSNFRRFLRCGWLILISGIASFLVTASTKFSVSCQSRRIVGNSKKVAFDSGKTRKSSEIRKKWHEFELRQWRLRQVRLGCGFDVRCGFRV